MKKVLLVCLLTILLVGCTFPGGARRAEPSLPIAVEILPTPTGVELPSVFLRNFYPTSGFGYKVYYGWCIFPTDCRNDDGYLENYVMILGPYYPWSFSGGWETQVQATKERWAFENPTIKLDEGDFGFLFGEIILFPKGRLVEVFFRQEGKKEASIEMEWEAVFYLTIVVPGRSMSGYYRFSVLESGVPVLQKYLG